MWVLVTAFLVFFMQAGFMMLEAGFARIRESSNILMECIVDTCLCGMLFWAFGFAFMFGTGNGWIGHEFFFLNNAPATYGTTGVAFLAFFLFQFAFADTCSTITSGAMVGRTAFRGDLLYSIGVSGFIYPILGHWVWGPGGWLATWNTPFRDFAGSTVVHTIGGMIALAGAIALGPRLGRKFKRDGGGMPPGHDMTIAALGGVILWFGWYGFNPGSTLSAMDFDGIGRVATNTTLAACAGWSVGHVLRLSDDPGSGTRASRSTASSPASSPSPVRATGCHRSARSASARSPAWSCARRRPHRVAPDRRPDRRGRGARRLRHLGHAQPRAVRHRPVRPADADRAPTCSTPVEGLFYGGGAKQLVTRSSAARSSPSVDVRRRPRADVRRQGARRAPGLRGGRARGLDIHEHGAPAYHPESAYMGYSAMPSGRRSAWPRTAPNLRPSASATEEDTCISSRQSSSRTCSKT